MQKKKNPTMFPLLLLDSEWIDFPRADQHLPDGKIIRGNGFSYDKCRRRFDLVRFYLCFVFLVFSTMNEVCVKHM